MGLIAFIVFGIFSSPLLYAATSFLGSRRTVTSNGQTLHLPTVTGNLLHAIVAGLVTFLLGYLIMLPWKYDKCCKPMKKPITLAMARVRAHRASASY